ncbi:MAG: hypothetical protein N4J56_008002 [Chroococcidiopsis sp. SAG 2025]|nr:hypothetical protein [Chroococcidiopsis sp. SAG 2025]
MHSGIGPKIARQFHQVIRCHIKPFCLRRRQACCLAIPLCCIFNIFFKKSKYILMESVGDRADSSIFPQHQFDSYQPRDWDLHTIKAKSGHLCLLKASVPIVPRLPLIACYPRGIKSTEARLTRFVFPVGFADTRESPKSAVSPPV